MMNETLATLLAVGIGWLLSEVSRFLRSRTERRASIGRALAELLEVRHYVLAVEAILEEARSRSLIAPDESATLLSLIDRFLPPDPTLPDRFNAAVSEIAEMDPLLAYRLRQKDYVPTFLLKMGSLQSSSSEISDGFTPLMQELRELSVDSLERAARRLALRHGVVSWMRVRRLQARRPKLPPRLSRYLDSVSDP